MATLGVLMPRKPRAIDRTKIKTVSARGRTSKVAVGDEATPYEPGSSFSEFLEGMPDILGARDLREAITAWAKAWSRDKTVLFGFGAHLIKVGLAPVVVDMLERGAISGIMMNGAGCVHDLELAMMGKTSEDVAEALDDGSFGMARETSEALNGAIAIGAAEGLGMGAAVGRAILEAPKRAYPHRDRSVLATAARLGIPVTVHTAIGTDIHHMHASADGAALGATSYRDFETLTGLVATLEGGALFNIGSAVILPEVFLKALALARNLENKVDRFTAVNLDFIRHYRPSVNVVQRPTRKGGSGLSIVGQHEVLVPLLVAGVLEAKTALDKSARSKVRKSAAKKRGK